MKRRSRNTSVEASANTGLPSVILDSLTIGVICTDDNGRIQHMNAAASRLTGFAQSHAEGLSLHDLLEKLTDDSQSTGELAKLLLNRNGQTSILAHRKYAEKFLPSLNLNSRPLVASGDNALKGMVITVCENTSDAQIAQAREALDVDALTGLLNREGFSRRLETLILDANTSSRTHAMLILDMDQFKLVNDLSGHLAGDALLKRLAHQLAGEIHKGDTIARLGGDEFGFLLCNLEIDESMTVARRLMAAVQALQFTWDGRVYQLSASVGIVPINETCASAVSAMSKADSALYAAKDAGRNRSHVYTPDDDELTRRHSEMEWAGRIANAFDKGQFRLAAQAITPLLGHEKGEHYEVLIRLLDGDKLIAPGNFIPAAERYGLMGRIDRWVVKTFLDYLEHHPQAADSLCMSSINLSGPSLVDEDFRLFLIEQLERPHIRAEKICFEVTETAAITNFTHASHFIKTVRQLGCQFSLDDFGSGMSSFGYLRQLPVDYLKIDGVFVRDMENDQVHSAMVNAINEIGHAMGKKTIAEFVANKQILQKLEIIGVDYAQGYYLGEPKLLDMSRMASTATH